MKKEIRELNNGEEGKWYSSNGSILTEEKSLNNKITVDSNNFQHNINDLPAYIEYYKNGVKSMEIWYNHGYPHHLTGPSHIFYHKNAEISGYMYSINGKIVSEYDFKVSLNRIKMLEEL